MPYFKEGEKNRNEVYFRNENIPAIFYVRLYYDTPNQEDTLATLQGEPTGNGYVAQPLSRNTTDWPTLIDDFGDWKVISKLVTFASSGAGWGPVNCVVLATSADSSGKAIFWTNLRYPVSRSGGDELDIVLQNKEMSV